MEYIFSNEDPEKFVWGTVCYRLAESGRRWRTSIFSSRDCNSSIGYTQRRPCPSDSSGTIVMGPDIYIYILHLHAQTGPRIYPTGSLIPSTFPIVHCNRYSKDARQKGSLVASSNLGWLWKTPIQLDDFPIYFPISKVQMFDCHLKWPEGIDLPIAIINHYPPLLKHGIHHYQPL